MPRKVVGPAPDLSPVESDRLIKAKLLLFLLYLPIYFVWYCVQMKSVNKYVFLSFK